MLCSQISYHSKENRKIGLKFERKVIYLYLRTKNFSLLNLFNRFLYAYYKNVEISYRFLVFDFF